MKQHRYEIQMDWTGNTGQGTQAYGSYLRDHVITAHGKPPLAGSSDPAFRGDPSRYSPEDLLVASLSSCHMLWYLHLCSANQVVVAGYRDIAVGFMTETPGGSGAFSEVILRPHVRLTRSSDPAKALALHEDAHRFCFIANSVKFPVKLEPRINESDPAETGNR